MMKRSMRQLRQTIAPIAALVFAWAAPAFAADRYWVAGTAANWDNSANWSASSGGAGGETVPSAADTAIFDGNGVENCALDAEVNVLGLSPKATIP